jgi:hypothetical protein
VILSKSSVYLECLGDKKWCICLGLVAALKEVSVRLIVLATPTTSTALLSPFTRIPPPAATGRAKVMVSQ